MTKRNRALTAANKRRAELPPLPPTPRWIEALSESRLRERWFDFEEKHPIYTTLIVGGATALVLIIWTGVVVLAGGFGHG